VIRIAISQQASVGWKGRTRVDFLEQNWWPFLFECGLHPLVIPNHCKSARRIIETTPIDGVLLTGGNDLVAYGGDAYEREETEDFLLRYCIETSIPLLGVCRGMQFVQHAFGVPLVRVYGHAASNCFIYYKNVFRTVNSFHNWGAMGSVPLLNIAAMSADGVVKAIAHSELPIIGIMWHPERELTVDINDITLFKSHFGV
jgi:N5-(cytidine 5'-diphosphoramidyl)-L-glutamine hydrolase